MESPESLKGSLGRGRMGEGREGGGRPGVLTTPGKVANTAQRSRGGGRPRRTGSNGSARRTGSKGT